MAIAPTASLSELDSAELLNALQALRRGDFSTRLPASWSGMAGRIADTFNDIVAVTEHLASELARLNRAVGKEGRISQRAALAGMSGGWLECGTAVNSLIDDLVAPTHAMARVIGAVAKGDLSQSVILERDGQRLEGEFRRTAMTVNSMVSQLGSFASEVTRVVREVGTEGKLGGQANVRRVAGTWKDLTDSVNSMAGNLTGQVRNIAEVTTAVANGDLSKKITVDVKGEFFELKNTINTMVDQLRSFGSEVTRVAREVGTEGRLGGQARVDGVSGTWKDLTDSVNFMASNLTSQVRNIADVTKAVAAGDLSKKITVDVKGEILELKNTINTMVDQLSSFAAEVTRVAREVGTEGRLGGQADVKGVSGTWKDLTDSVNFMASNLTGQVRNIADVTTAVANGDLSKKITVEVKGEILELKNTVNTMVDQLSSFAAEVTRVAREVGTEGKLGGQAQVQDVSGTWRGLTENVNFMAANLTSQVRGIARVVTAVANGDLRQKLTVEAKGEIAELSNTINSMIDTLATFADQVTSVAREVGVEGKLGGQARVPGAAGTWRALTDNVNQLAANLTTQVRAIAEVATAVTKGDLTQSIKVEAQGEVAALKDNINEMIRNLKDTTLKNSEQDWLKTNLAKFSRMLQGQKDLLTVARLILSELAPVVKAQHGVFYIFRAAERPRPATLALLASYAHGKVGEAARELHLGEGLIGQCAIERQKIFLENVPPDYIRISSGLGDAAPANIIVLPILFEGQIKAVLELASFERFAASDQALLDQLTESIGIVINTIEANMRTEGLLRQSQSLAAELQSRQEELQNTNQELQDKARLLADQNVEVEQKNQEVEHARKALEEKAEQLALTSKYKSEFLANMSHELRTPLNSLLILSDQLSKNADGNLTDKQTEFAKTIHSSGTDLLMLINDILDLSKIESGTVVVDVSELPLTDLHRYVERTFRHVAESKGLDFAVRLSPSLPRAMVTDAKRLQQVIKNLLSNAFKFTRRGGVALEITAADPEALRESPGLAKAESVLAFAVSDTGIGIPLEKQQIIFEAFQQADGSTSRKYGGTGLGLAISREIARLLGGEIHLVSAMGHGSTFTLYLPQTFAPPAAARGTSGEASPVSVPVALIHGAEEDIAPPHMPLNDIVDDRDRLAPGDRTLLIVENDMAFARLLADVARETGFKVLVTSFGSTALALVRQHHPSAITLDISLPDMEGWRVLERLKSDFETRHVPVTVITTGEDVRRGRTLGAFDTVGKPIETRDGLRETLERLMSCVARPQKELVVVHPDPVERAALTQLLASDGVRVLAVPSLSGLNGGLDGARIDGVVLGVGAEAEAVEVLGSGGRGARLAALPVIAYGPPLWGARVEGLLKARGVELTVVPVSSPERLVDQCLLRLHRPVRTMSESHRGIVERLHHGAHHLTGRRVLIVDDDIRNIFALTSILERHEMRIASAETGRGAIELLDRHGDFEVVLMDLMMPEMDGFETMRAIRDDARFRALPIIAVTAKAMKGDREKCIEAGASDYLAKPVDSEELVSKLRDWLAR